MADYLTDSFVARLQAAWRAFYPLQRWKYRAFPGPPPLPVTGNLLEASALPTTFACLLPALRESHNVQSLIHGAKLQQVVQLCPVHDARVAQVELYSSLITCR